VEDQLIANQVLEAEGVIRELAVHLQRAVDMADAAFEAKESYGASQLGLEAAADHIISSRQALSEATAAAQRDFALGALNLQSAGMALTAFADRTAQTFEGLQVEVAKLASRAGDLQEIVVLGDKNIGDESQQIRAQASQESARQLARIDAVGEQVTGLTSRLNNVESSFRTSFSALETAIKREAARTEQASLKTLQKLGTKLNHVLLAAAILVVLKVIFH